MNDFNKFTGNGRRSQDRPGGPPESRPFFGDGAGRDEFVVVDGGEPVRVWSRRTEIDGSGRVFDKETRFLKKDRFNRYISPAEVVGVSWTDLPLTEDTCVKCLNPWGLHGPRWCCLEGDGNFTEIDARAVGGGHHPLCTVCLWQNRWQRVKCVVTLGFFDIKFY